MKMRGISTYELRERGQGRPLDERARLAGVDTALTDRTGPQTAQFIIHADLQVAILL